MKRWVYQTVTYIRHNSLIMRVINSDCPCLRFTRLTGLWKNLAGFFLAIVDVVRGLMRPVITLYTLGLLTAIGWLLYEAANEVIPKMPALWLEIVQAVILLATTSVTWWFGSRQMRRQID
ncbi:MAG: hypothetical protein AB2784_15440 [Candidatus Thiodiazotropha endolucinida]